MPCKPSVPDHLCPDKIREKKRQEALRLGKRSNTPPPAPQEAVIDGKRVILKLAKK